MVYVCSSTIRFHHFCLVHERTSSPQRVGTCMSPILVTKRLVTNLLTRSSQRGHLSNYLLPSVLPICCHLHYHFLACLLSFSRAMDSHLDVAPGVSACDESKTACKYRVYPSLSPQCSTPLGAAVICKLWTEC